MAKGKRFVNVFNRPEAPGRGPKHYLKLFEEVDAVKFCKMVMAKHPKNREAEAADLNDYSNIYRFCKDHIAGQIISLDCDDTDVHYMDSWNPDGVFDINGDDDDVFNSHSFDYTNIRQFCIVEFGSEPREIHRYSGYYSCESYDVGYYGEDILVTEYDSFDVAFIVFDDGIYSVIIDEGRIEPMSLKDALILCLNDDYEYWSKSANQCFSGSLIHKIFSTDQIKMMIRSHFSIAKN